MYILVVKMSAKTPIMSRMHTEEFYSSRKLVGPTGENDICATKRMMKAAGSLNWGLFDSLGVEVLP